MKVAVVGAGFTGLAAAIDLVDKGVEVEVFEKENYVGGLAGGIKKKGWSWNLEFFYHHVFTNDKEILELANKVGLPAKIYSPVTASLINKKVLQLDSPLSVLKFSELSILSRLRMGLGLGLLKVIPNGIFLEKYTAAKLLPKLIGVEAYKKIWERLLRAKFGKYISTVNMAWFWSRVAKRSKNLGYFDGGFENLAVKMKEYIEKRGGKVHTGAPFGENKTQQDEYDKVILTTPAPIAEKIVGEKLMPKIDYLWAQTMVLEIREAFMDNYWLNILEDGWPFLVAVEHTKMISKNNYNGNTILYLGNYLNETDEQLKMDTNDLLDIYSKKLRQINPNFKDEWIISSQVFRAPFAQPVFPINYSQELNKLARTKGKFLFANMSMVYPYDRGTNYAVKIGQEVAKKCLA